MKKKLLFVLLSIAAFTGSCKKEKKDTGGSGIVTDKIAPDGFNFSTTKKVNITVRLLTNNGQPLSGVLVDVTYDIKEDAAALLKGVTDKAGYMRGSVIIPSSRDTLIISPNYTGLIQHAATLLMGGDVNVVLGGPAGYYGNIIAPGLITKKAGNVNQVLVNYDGTDYVYPSGEKSSEAVSQPYGRPLYLEPKGDDIDKSLLEKINASLPEGEPVSKHHPEYLSEKTVSSLDIKEESDVWVTFVSESTAYLNSLGYYTYPTGKPPVNPSDIATVTLVFPNASEKGSDGELISGDKVNIGHFEAGTSVGLVLLQNAWVDAGKYYGVEPGKNRFYTTSALNPESDPSLQKQSVLLYDAVNNLFLFGFEDTNRESAKENDKEYQGDDDFNDLVIYATSKPAKGIDNTNIADMEQGITDSDGDGIADESDEFPNDTQRAYTTATAWNMLAFEDRWPEAGDYDMNDLVVNCRYTYTSNAQNQVVDITGDYTVLAAGASFENGFGVQFPFSPDLVSKVSGQRLIRSYIKQNSNGLEGGQSKAVIIPFDSYKALINNTAGAFFVNTKPALPKITGDTAHVYLEFTSPVEVSVIGSVPFNPFLIVNMKRAYEVHLPGCLPTDMANQKLFGTYQDDSNPSKGKYYQSETNWPWAINMEGSFAYPTEESPVSKAYPHFLDWTASGGNAFADWFTNTSSGYREQQLIYSK